MRVVVALGGNALARRGEPMTAERLRANVRSTMEALAGFAREHEVVITHGNGPQVGLVALRHLAYTEVAAYPLDILGAETQGMIGYVVQQELSNALGGQREVAGIITTTVVDPQDPAFVQPTKLVGPTYDKAEAESLAATYGWSIAADGEVYRRVVPSPPALSIVQAPLIKRLLEAGSLAVCVGGGGVPVYADADGRHVGVEAVVDKDGASATLAAAIDADTLIMLTDGDYVSENWGTPQQRDILTASADAVAAMQFAAGSMQPKIDAAIRVARAGGRTLIGPLDRLDDLLARRIGTEIVPTLAEGIRWVQKQPTASA